MGRISTENTDKPAACLEAADGHSWPLGASCSIGRSPSNHIVLEDRHVSRRHAIVLRQHSKEYWLMDLGSGNGSFINDLRIATPTILHDGDCVRIGESVLTFRQAASARLNPNPVTPASMTVMEVKDATCWMVVADIVGSTGLATKYEPAHWASLVGSWTGGCRRIVEMHGGVINKYLGDGFLAIWPRDGQPTKSVKTALDGLLDLQKGSELPFRIAVHFGKLVMGGGRSLGEDSLSGLELVFLFRMEKIAGTLNRSFLCSEPAADKLGPYIDLEIAGQYSVAGFVDSRPRRFFGIRSK
ncbi:MAG: FHA domain-containing protein [Hyphomicrobium sp.]|uniref:FHA domain-containing protein n=1 Tax=Hyphomicrobium sp. TaxID=82 RepID=UPI003D12E426